MLGKEVVGYVINTELRANAQLRKIDKAISDKFGSRLWLQPENSRHITLMDWLAPLVNYNENKENLFKEIFENYDSLLTKILDKQNPIQLMFNKIFASDNAIYITSEDGGAFNNIRKEFLSSVNLIPGTKPPPTIVHSTIARTDSNISPKELQDFTAIQRVEFMQTVSAFRLIKETQTPMLNFEILKEYKLLK